MGVRYLLFHFFQIASICLSFLILTSSGFFDNPIVSSLKESGVDYGFDPTSGQSLGESLARAAFEQDVKGQI